MAALAAACEFVAIGEFFQSPCRAAGNIALKAWCIPPAKPVVLIASVSENSWWISRRKRAEQRTRAKKMAVLVRTKNHVFHFPLKNAFPQLFFSFSGHQIPQL
ncbi:MAG: hypothetical protein L6W00_03840 [Lentisphaeria bacterium]|nr:MAG: hypothetical protein L6W00_03840 [Lentisphaeria bacterium]